MGSERGEGGKERRNSEEKEKRREEKTEKRKFCRMMGTVALSQAKEANGE